MSIRYRHSKKASHLKFTVKHRPATLPVFDDVSRVVSTIRSHSSGIIQIFMNQAGVARSFAMQLSTNLPFSRIVSADNFYSDLQSVQIQDKDVVLVIDAHVLRDESVASLLELLPPTGRKVFIGRRAPDIYWSANLMQMPRIATLIIDQLVRIPAHVDVLEATVDFNIQWTHTELASTEPVREGDAQILDANAVPVSAAPGTPIVLSGSTIRQLGGHKRAVLPVRSAIYRPGMPGIVVYVNPKYNITTVLLANGATVYIAYAPEPAPFFVTNKIFPPHLAGIPRMPPNFITNSHAFPITSHL